MELFKREKEGYHITAQPAWCSDGLWDTLTGMARELGGILKFNSGFSKAEKKILKKRKPIKTSKWAEKNRVLTKSALPGLWKNEVTPYLVGLMDVADLPYVREITTCKTPQTGGSEGVHNCIGKRIDRDPGDVLYVYPDEKTGKENCQDRILPMIQSSARLRSYFTGQERDKSSLRIHLQHMDIFIGWGRSASSLANKPIRYAIADEIDKSGFDAGTKETSPLGLIDDRLTTYRDISLFWKISTPTLPSGNIWVEFNKAQAKFDYYAKCPMCGQLELMDFKGIKWEGGGQADPREIKSRKLAWYECSHCQGKWDDEDRNTAVRCGCWIERESKLELFTHMEKHRAATVGFHIPAWISYFVSLSECAAAFLDVQGDPIKLQRFLNSFCAQPFELRVANKSEQEILKHKNDLPAGVVPEGAMALTCGIDVQKQGFWFVVRAWDRDLNSHLVQYGYLSTWSDVNQLVFRTRYPVQGKSEDHTMGIWRAAMDTGGGPNADSEWTRTEEVYHWIRKNGRGVIFGIKGANKAQTRRVNPKVIDKMARGNRPIPGGLTLYFLDVGQFKDLFHWRLSRHYPGMTDEDGKQIKAQSQHMTLNADTGVDYAMQILAEEKQQDRKGNSKWVAVRRDNHLLDCENYAAACADPEWAPSLTFMASRLPGKQPKQNQNNQPQNGQKPGAGIRDGRPSWFNRR